MADFRNQSDEQIEPEELDLLVGKFPEVGQEFVRVSKRIKDVLFQGKPAVSKINDKLDDAMRFLSQDDILDVINFLMTKRIGANWQLAIGTAFENLKSSDKDIEKYLIGLNSKPKAAGPERYAANKYAKHVIGGRWKEYEDVLLMPGFRHNVDDYHEMIFATNSWQRKKRWKEYEDWLIECGRELLRTGDSKWAWYVGFNADKYVDHVKGASPELKSLVNELDDKFSTNIRVSK